MKKPLPKRQVLLCLVFSLVSTLTMAQFTATFSPQNTTWTDATLINSTSTNNINYGNYDQISMAGLTSNVIHRSLVRVDLSKITAGTVIQSAKLVVTNYTYGTAQNSNVGTNPFYVRRVTQSWDESTVTWNNQPSYTTTDGVSVPAWTGSTPNPLEIDVTAIVQYMINNPTLNRGFLFRLQTETGPTNKARNFASTNYAAQPTWAPKLVITSTQPLSTEPFDVRRDYIFGSLDQTAINTGILTDAAIEFSVDPTLYNGVITTGNEMNITLWNSLLGKFNTASLNPSSAVPHIKTINDALDNLWSLAPDRSNHTVHVPVMFVRYQTLRSDAVPNLVTSNNGRLLDVPGRTQSPYTTSYAFAAAPTRTWVAGNATFNFPSATFVNSSDKTMTAFAVDFGNGAGYQTVALNTPVSIAYTTSGVKTLKFKMTVTGGQIYYSHGKIDVIGTGGAQARYASSDLRTYKFPRATDPDCPETSYPNPELFEGSYYGATIEVQYSSIFSAYRGSNVCVAKFIKPLIVCKGFDVSKFAAFGMDRVNLASFMASNVDGSIGLGLSKGGFLPDKLDSAGYDIVYINFDEGTGDIQRNALLVENVIQWVNLHKIIGPSGQREKNVLFGQSMGGLVARYAVCDLEKRRDANASYPAHEVRTLITQDSPHRGANVPIGFQTVVNKLASMNLGKIGLATYGVGAGIIGSQIDLQDVIPVLKAGKQLLNEPATKQMLVIQDGMTNTFLDGAYRSMITFTSGHVDSFNSVALSNGSECGQGQLIQPGAELFYASSQLYTDPIFFITAQVAAPIAYSIKPNPGLQKFLEIPTLLLTPLSGRTWKTDMAIYSTDINGSGTVFTGKIVMEKKIAFLIPLNFTIYDGSTTVSSQGHWDSRPGGFYELGTAIPKVPGKNINYYPIGVAKLTVRFADDFTFVPTVSAVDIKTTPLTPAAITSPYTGGSNSTYPSSFNNFRTQEKNPLPPSQVAGGVYNTPHVQFTPQNAKWFYEVIIGQNPIVNCSYVCTASDMTVTGPGTLCTSAQAYTLNNIPPGTTISWGISGLISVPPNSNSATVSVTPLATTYTSATLTGNAKSFTCGDYKAAKSIVMGNAPWLRESTNNDGSPSYVNIGPNPTAPSQQEIQIMWLADYPQKITPITMSAGGNVSASWPSTPTSSAAIAVTFPTAGTYTLAADTQGPCGPLHADQVINVYSGSGFRSALGDSTMSEESSESMEGTRIADSEFMYSPNPVSNYLTVVHSPGIDGMAIKVLSTGRKGTVVVRLKDSTGNVLNVNAKEDEQSGGVILDTSTLPDGLYYLIVTDQGKSFTVRVLITH